MKNVLEKNYVFSICITFSTHAEQH
jgi:hypothetical protein